MTSNTASQFMDKQIMDLSNSQSSGVNNDFIDFMNRSEEKRDDIVPSYDFMPIRPGVGLSSPLLTENHVSKFDSGEEDTSLRTWNSLDSKINVTSNRSQQPLNASLSASLVSEIDKTVKKYTDNLMHTMDGVSARLFQLETRTRKLENFMDDLKESVGNNLGVIDGKLRQMGNILREVQTGVQVISDKQAKVGELPAAKLQSPNLEQVESENLAHAEPTQSVASANQQLSTVSLTQPPPSLPPPNAPPPPPPQQNSESHVQFPNHYSQNQTTSVPQQESYFPPSDQTPQQQYQVPLPPHQHQHQHQHQFLAPPPQHQNQPPPPQHQHQPPPPQPQYSQPPPPQHQHQPPPPPQPHFQPPPPSQPQSQPPPPPPPPPPPQLHPPFSAINTSLPQSQLSHHSEETLYGPPQTYPSGIRPPLSHPSVVVPPPQRLYIHTPNVYEPQSSRPIPGYSHSFGQSAGHVEPYPYNSSPSQYGSDSPRKPHQFPSNAGGHGSGSGYPQLPTARILPQEIPTASNVGGGSGTGSSGNKVPIDDVVEKVTHMGFPRDQVRATVRKLTENGQAVDLNVVLDKLMNDTEGQPPRGWFGR